MTVSIVLIAVFVVWAILWFGRGRVKDARIRRFMDAGVLLVWGVLFLLLYGFEGHRTLNLVLGLVALLGGVYELARPRPKGM